jgi:hypothetical protein
MHHRRGSLFRRRKCHRYHRHYHHQQQRTNPIIHPRLLPCPPTRLFPSSEKSSPPPFGGDSNLLVAISLVLVPITTTDSSTTSVFEKAQSAAPAGRLDKKSATPYHESEPFGYRVETVQNTTHGGVEPRVIQWTLHSPAVSGNVPGCWGGLVAWHRRRKYSISSI